MLLTWIGVGCIAYTSFEIARAWGAQPNGRFGAVDAATGRPIEVTLDRRARSRQRIAR
jgi:hypothetical protein